ncbi:protein-glutamate methylesterase/protein-glutamine glutaminase [Calderihabitans maritimus]|uniref:Protein-glutamate methylesterase/protein-glutamine glutaminase n=1 Tax=Calderihabitans maritimus TaxID=1246530 RepID=A0A1Z5HTN4_9FIRM|nr:chemotaxis response regulator protein-glutamate methylesterase [Calderihabitans maritimus]GAW92899.1 chemotaxis replicative DNA helicase [Calderihabitans maritimus]
MKEPVRVLVVDDSALMRRIITQMLDKDPGIQVVGFARNGLEVLDKIPRLRPDVVTLDVEMPGKNGLETLQEIMERFPLPVVMVSALTVQGAYETVRALELGAVDFVTKPTGRGDFVRLAPELVLKVKTAADVRVKKEIDKKPVGPTVFRSRRQARKVELVVIGASTGGPAALAKIIPRLPADFPAGIVIVQHIPPGFTRPLAERLNERSQIEVREAEEGDLIRPGRALVAPAGRHTVFRLSPDGVRVRLVDDFPLETRFKPSVDVTMLAAAEIFGGGCLGVVLTGMGNDGVRGLQAIEAREGITIAEDESTCVVFGMPRAAIEAGVVDRVVPLNRITAEILSLTEK